MKKLSLYPITPISRTVMNNSSLISNYSINRILSYDECVHNEQRFGYVHEITNSIEFEKNEHVMLCDNDYNLSIEGYIKTINFLNERNVPIILSRKLHDLLNDKTNIRNAQILSDTWNEREIYSVLKNIDIPVISVMGLGENCDKFATQVFLNDSIKKTGLKTLPICSNPAGLLFGMKLLPQFLFESKLSLTNKIIKFNNLLYDLIGEEKPDIIILGCPGGILQYNQYSYNYFGELPYILSNAVAPDIGILNIYFMPDVNNTFLQCMDDVCKRKYNVSIFSYIMSNQNRSFDQEDMCNIYKYYDEEFCLKHLPDTMDYKNRLFRSIDKTGIGIISKQIYYILKNAVQAV